MAARVQAGAGLDIHSGRGAALPCVVFTAACRPVPTRYTANPAECANLRVLQASTPATHKRWNFESLDFLTTVPVNGACPSGTVPIYRAYNNGFTGGVDSNHRITSSQTAIQQVLADGWTNEGVVMCAPQ